MPTAATATNPHQRVQESKSFVTSLHGQIETVLVAARVDSVSRSLIIDLLENILSASEPAVSLDHDKSRGLFGGLEKVACTKLGSLILGNDLSILTTRLIE